MWILDFIGVPYEVLVIESYVPGLDQAFTFAVFMFSTFD